MNEWYVSLLTGVWYSQQKQEINQLLLFRARLETHSPPFRLLTWPYNPCVRHVLWRHRGGTQRHFFGRGGETSRLLRRKSLRRNKD